jgi:hypothetical protein
MREKNSINSKKKKDYFFENKNSFDYNFDMDDNNKKDIDNNKRTNKQKRNKKNKDDIFSPNTYSENLNNIQNNTNNITIINDNKYKDDNYFQDLIKRNFEDN